MAVSMEEKQRKIVFPFSVKGQASTVQLKWQLKASEGFPAGMVHPDVLKHSLTSLD